MAEDTRKNILEVDVVQSIDKTDTVLVNDSGSLKQVSVETLVSSGIPDQYVTESELTGKGYATTTDLPTKISDLSNDSGFITNDDIPQKLPNPQKIIFTGAVSVEYDGTTQQTVNIPNSGGSGGSYTLPIMSSSQLGGGKAVAKTDEDVPVAVDTETGQLFVPTYPSGSGYDTSQQTAYQLIVEKILSAEEAEVTSFTFTSEEYPLIEQCNEFLVAIVNASNKNMPYWRVNINGKGDVSNGGGTMGTSYARVSLKGSLVSIRISAWINNSLAGAITSSVGTGNLASYELLKDIKIDGDKITSIKVSSYQAFLDEGAEIKIYGWRV